MTAQQRRESDQQARWRLASGLRLLAKLVDEQRFPSWYADRVANELGRYITLAQHIEGKPVDPEEAQAAKIAILAEAQPRPAIERVGGLSFLDRLKAWARPDRRRGRRSITLPARS